MEAFVLWHLGLILMGLFLGLCYFVVGCFFYGVMSHNDKYGMKTSVMWGVFWPLGLCFVVLVLTIGCLFVFIKRLFAKILNYSNTDIDNKFVAKGKRFGRWIDNKLPSMD